MIKCIINDSTLNIESVFFSYSVSKKCCRIKSIINHDERFDLKVFCKAGELPSTLMQTQCTSQYRGLLLKLKESGKKKS